MIKITILFPLSSRPPKTGSTTVRYAFEKIFQENAGSGRLPENFNEINQMAGNKIFIMRDPFLRLVSCYDEKYVKRQTNKCKINHYCGKTQFGPLIVNVSRPTATKEELANGCPTFDEFVRFVSTYRGYQDYDNEVNFMNTVRTECLRFDPRAIQHW